VPSCDANAFATDDVASLVAGAALDASLPKQRRATRSGPVVVAGDGEKSQGKRYDARDPSESHAAEHDAKLAW